MNVAVLIPSFEPSKKMCTLIEKLSEADFKKIIIVNDGSSDDKNKLYNKCERFKNCVVLRHEKNEGKGSAIKSGMKYYLDNLTGLKGIVTCDCDGQHTAADVIKVATMLEEKEDALILGSRDFNDTCVPGPNRRGNKLTRRLVDALCGRKLSDTQTGLRGIPHNTIKYLSELPGKKFDYEMIMLLEFINKDTEIIETPIETIYIDNNKDTHFRKFRDSVRIYWPMFSGFIKFSASAFAWYLLEFAIYTILIKLAFRDLDYGSLILTSQAVSKIISSTGNFFVNKHSVFKKDGDNIECLVKYGLVLLLLVVASSTLISMAMEVFDIGISNTAVIKLAVDFLMMIINFVLQRRWVFTDRHLIS